MKKLIIAAAFILLAGVTFGQTLPKGTVIGVHHVTITLDPDVTMNQYMDYLTEKYMPESEKQFKGWDYYVVKGDKGENKNKFGWLFIIESVEARDKYTKIEGGLTDAGREAMENMREVVEELNKLGTWSSEFTDWVIL